MFRELSWEIIAWLISRPVVSRRIIARAERHPDSNIDGYMNRGWVFNPYNRETRISKYPWFSFSARVHNILRADTTRHPHDHPWNARTIILRGGYLEHKEGAFRYRKPGDTARINFGEYHTIVSVEPGTFTLFIMGRYRGVWGFLVDGVKVPFYEYNEKDYPE
jgi:hypothetical protein